MSASHPSSEQKFVLYLKDGGAVLTTCGGWQKPPFGGVGYPKPRLFDSRSAARKMNYGLPNVGRFATRPATPGEMLS